MPRRSTNWITLPFTLFAAFSGLSSPSIAVPSTAQGQVSVAQVIEMLDEAPTERVARQVLMAYLSGLGEAAGVLLTAGNNTKLARCSKALSLSDAQARQALAAASRRKDRNEIAATPLLLSDMVRRAGCRLEP
jgi:hypothetical protein